MTMALTQPIMLTADDYRSMPETGPRYQLIDGDLIMSPAPNRYHQDITRNLEFLLLKYLEKRPIGKLYHAPFDVYLTQFNVFQPDILFVAKGRLSILTDAGAEGAPNLVIEILSPRTAILDRESKRKVYAREGVEELWLIDPACESITVFRLQENPEEPAAVYRLKDTLGSPCLPGFKLRARDIFRQ
jgi:Uma2 family endonuclease